MAKPASLPLIATDTNLADGTEVGSSVKLEPSAGVKAQGWVPGKGFAGRWWNWWANLVYQWVVYVNGLSTDAQFLGTVWSWTNRHIWSGSFGPGLHDSDTCEINYCDASGGTTYRTRVCLVSPLDIVGDDNSGLTVQTSASGTDVTFTSGSVTFGVDLSKYLPRGATLTLVRVLCTPGASGGLQVDVIRSTPNFSSPGLTGALTAAGVHSGTSIQTITSGALSLAEDATSTLNLLLSNGTGTATTVHGIEITFRDPGPRNY